MGGLLGTPGEDLEHASELPHMGGRTWRLYTHTCPSLLEDCSRLLLLHRE